MVGHVVQQFCWSRTWEAPQEHCEVLVGLFHKSSRTKGQCSILGLDQEVQMTLKRSFSYISAQA